MEFKGHIEGNTTKRYPDFSYRVPIFAPISVRQLDPERLNYMDEYPRSVNPPEKLILREKTVIDFVVRIGKRRVDGLSPVQVWLKPNKYTQSKAELMVFEYLVANALELRHEYYNEAIDRAFY